MRHDARPLTSEEFRDVIGRFASGVTVVTVNEGGRRYGATASAVSSLSLEPPMLLVCMNQNSSTGRAMERRRSFAVNILGEDQEELAVRFASGALDRFDDVDIAIGAHGQPLLADALATLVCRITEHTVGGTHRVFMAEVDVAEGRPGAPLAYFRGKFGRLEMAEDAFVYRELRERALAANERSAMAIRVLAGELQVNRSLIFHALCKLANEGLVQRQPDGDFVVRQLGPKAIADIYDARRALELGVAETTVGCVSADALAELRWRMERSVSLVQGARKRDQAIRANAQFHECMVSLAGSEALLNAYRHLAIPGIDTDPLDQEPLPDVDLVQDHRRLVEAYEASDLARVRTVVHDHTRRLQALTVAENEREIKRRQTLQEEHHARA